LKHERIPPLLIADAGMGLEDIVAGKVFERLVPSVAAGALSMQ